MAEMPDLVEVDRRLADRGARVQGVSLDLVSGAMRSPEHFEAYLRLSGLELPTFLFDGDARALSERWGLGSKIPFTVALDAAGNVVEWRVGPGSRADYVRMLQAALAASRRR